MSNNTPARYFTFGALLIQLRTKAGIAGQTELARLLGIRQQTVSRWERGLSRPRDKEIPRLATVLRADQEVLLEAAGYAPAAIPASFDRPFPLNALPPENFERFCHFFLEQLYRDSGGRVHRVGSSGHRQEGADICVTGSFGAHAFQCKRVEEFGPQKVRAAIEAHTAAASQKVLLLSNIASPQSRSALAGHPDWQIWDREDISLRIRSLPKAEQRTLVDTFFRGRRLELLGEPEPGPWMTPHQFFGPYLETTRLFNHTWRLVGRDAEAAVLSTAMLDDSLAVTMLVAPAGGGKTRLLRHAVESVDVGNAGRRIWFLSPTEELVSAHVEQLGPGKKLVVVDDAHDRDDLGVLFRYCAVPTNETRLLLALRPYGRESVKHQAATLALSGPEVSEIELHRPTRTEAEALASEVLTQCGGPTHAASAIASLTSDSPLATVVGAQIVARDKTHPALLGNVQDFETHILAAIEDVAAADIVTGADTDRMQGVLRIISLVQPILPDEPGLLNLLKDIEGIEEVHAVRLVRTLTDAGILFRRGLRYRLSPDLLADSIIVRHCISENGASNGYVERVFGAANPVFIKHLLINVGRLDWRRRNGRIEDSRLLEGVWQQLRWQGDYSNPHVEAAIAVAYYQPRLALRFARKLIEEGHGSNSSVARMLKNVAYNLDCLDEACELLWLSSCGAERQANRELPYGIKTLKELAQFEPNKPEQFMSKVVEFALALIDAPGTQTQTHSPFDILKGALAAEGHSAIAANRLTINLTGFSADRRVVRQVRERIIDSLLAWIEQGSPRKAFLAAETLADALRGPIGILGSRVPLEVMNEWRQEHQQTIERLASQLTRGPVHPVVLVRAAESVAWHAFHDGQAGASARTVLNLLDRDLETRLTRALMDGWGTNTWSLDEGAPDLRQSYHNHLLALKADLGRTFKEAGALYDFVEKCFVEVSNVAALNNGSPGVVIDYLIEAIPQLTEELLARDSSGQAGPLSAYTGTALSVLLKNPETSRNSLQNLIGTSTKGARIVAEAYARFEPARGYAEADVSLLRSIFSSQDEVVLHYASRAARQVARCDKPLAVSLACSVDLVSAGRAVHDLFMWLSHRDTIPRECIGEEQWRQLLANLEPVEDLDDYWIRQFLKDALQVSPDDLIRFIKNRLARAEGLENWSYAPLTKPFKEGESLGLLELADSARHLRTLLDWALERAENNDSLQRLGQAIAGLCGDYDEKLLDQLMQWMVGGSDRHARVVAAVLADAQDDIIFDHSDLVRRILATAQGISQEAVRRISSSLHMASTFGIRSTTPGEPFPEDVRMEKHASEVLGTLSRWDPAYELYDSLLRSAKLGIERQQREKEAMDAEADE